MLDDPKPEDPLFTTVGNWNKFGRSSFNKGVQSGVKLVLDTIESSNLTKENNLVLFRLLKNFEKLKKEE